MNTKQLKYVLALAQEGNFSRAADRLNITQPSFSQYIKKIEKELNTELFDRSGSEVKLTEAGKIYVDTGCKMLELEHQMEQKLTDISSFKSGSIRVGISPYRSLLFMPQVIAAFYKKYPGISIVLDERIGTELIEGAERGDFDLCITTLPVNEKIFSYELIMQEEILVAVPAESRVNNKLKIASRVLSNRERRSVDIKLLSEEPFVMLGETQNMQHILQNICRQTNINISKSVECRSIDAQIAMVKAGIGAAFIPSNMASVSDDDRIAFYSLNQELGKRDVVVLHRNKQYISEPIAELKTIIKEQIKIMNGELG